MVKIDPPSLFVKLASMAMIFLYFGYKLRALMLCLLIIATYRYVIAWLFNI
jgi:hypothetical protein